MLKDFDSSDMTSEAATKQLREMTRVTSVGDKVNVHVVQVPSEPSPDFEAMRRLVAGPEKQGKVTNTNERPKA